jgi:hypothetical protein
MKNQNLKFISFPLFLLLGIIYLNNGPTRISLKTYLKNNRTPASAKGLDVTIAAGDSVSITESTNINHLVINGELHCDEANADNEIILQAKSIKVTGLLKCGSVTNTYDKKFIISLKPSNLDPKTDHRYRGLVVMGSGQLDLFGNRANSRWYKLKTTLQAGSNELFIDNGLVRAVQTIRNVKSFKKSTRRRAINIRRLGWKIGDEIVVAPTAYNPSESEKFIITGFDKSDPSKVYLDHPALYNHFGEKQLMDSSAIGRFNLDERAEVANLTRSIVIRGDESQGAILETDTPGAEWGAHVMVHGGSTSYIDAVEFTKVGQAGVMARYPFHWHYTGDASGQFVRNSSIHNSYQRCITIHRTQNADLINNVCFDFKGHGYFLEDGNETGNRIIRNLAISAKAPYESKVLLRSDSIQHSETAGRFPSVSGFWISNPDNKIMHNTLSGSVGSGFWMAFESEVKDSSGNVVARPLTTNTDIFNYNTARTARVGITWDGAPGWQSANNPNNPNDKILVNAHYAPTVVPVFKGLKAYKNILSGIYFRGQSVVFKNSIIADSGWGAWMAYNQIFQESVFVGSTQNTSPEIEDYFYNNVSRSSRYRRNGITLYDGPFEVHNSDFLNFSTEEQTRVINGKTEITSYVPFTSTGGTNKYVNYVSALNFSPEPLHKMHIHSKVQRWRETPMLGNSAIRDMDGSLTGTPGSIVVGERSLGADSRCTPGGASFENHLVCAPSYTEGAMNYMRWGGPVSPWATPYIALRSDGEVNYPIEEWNSISSVPNNTIATANGSSYSYKILPKFQYKYDKDIGTTARIEANTESENPVQPVLQIVAYGYNCELNDDAIRVNSIQELFSSNQTSYYSNGERFYVRLIPHERWRMYSDNPYIQSTANATNFRYSITCDDRAIDKVIKGKITNVTKTRDNTIIEGWACNYTHSSSINTKLYIGDSIHSRSFNFIGQEYANDDPDVKIGVECGSVRSTGRKFRYVVDNTTIEQYGVKKKIFIEGVSNSGGTDKFIIGSGKWNVLGQKIKFGIRK